MGPGGVDNQDVEEEQLLTYTLITSLIGGLQMFDVPQILTAGKGAPDAKNSMAKAEAMIRLGR